MRDVAIIGVGMTKWGELWRKSLRTIFTESALLALEDAGVDHFDSLLVGCMSSGLFVGQEHLASLLADSLGRIPVPAARVESACASGGLALRQGVIEVASGASDIVLVGGVEKMTDVTGCEATFALGTAADQEYEGYHGLTFPGLYAMMAVAHMHRYGTTREQLALVAVKNHDNGSRNPLAQFPFKVTVDDVLNSVLVADPLRILDCSPITDGAAAVVLCPADMARKMKKPVVRITGIGQATDTIALSSRRDLAWLESTHLAAGKALAMAGRKLDEIDLFEVHDCFTIAEIMVTEALGIAEKGKGGQAVEEGLTARDGRYPVNPSGGLKQLRGEAGDRQIKGAKRGLTQNMGGTGGSSVVHVFEAE
jgi:acetyl-CoA C-acetyltransferase